MQLDPELAAMLPFIPPQDFEDIDRCRSLSGQVSAPFDRSSVPEVVFESYRLTRPDGSDLPITVISNPATRHHTAVLMHIHGGGFAIGDPSFDDAENAAIVARTGVTIVSPDYRLAPEYPFPAAFEDCCQTLEWMVGTEFPWSNPARMIAVMGHSAGGGLAAAVALWCRDVSGICLDAQLLLEPELDARLATRSMRNGTDTPIWYLDNAIRSWKYYLAGQELTPFASPATASSLAGLPRTYLTVNQCDPLRDEGLEYAWRLMEDDVTTELHMWPGTYHGFMAVSSAAITHRALDHLVSVIDSWLAPRLPMSVVGTTDR